MSPRTVAKVAVADPPKASAVSAVPQPAKPQFAEVAAAPAAKTRARNKVKPPPECKQPAGQSELPNSLVLQPPKVAKLSEEKSASPSAQSRAIVPWTPKKREYPTKNKLGAASRYLGVHFHNLTGK